MLTTVQGDALDSEHLSELTEEEFEVNVVKPHLKGFLKFDIKYLIPFFTRRFTQQVLVDMVCGGSTLPVQSANLIVVFIVKSSCLITESMRNCLCGVKIFKTCNL